MSVAAYRTGDDVALDYLGQRFSFARADFEVRLEEAARRLGLVGRGALRGSDRADLVELAVSASLRTPRSAFGRALADRVAELAERDEDVVYWLRKLVFRRAWLDQRVKAGLVDVVFDERDGSFGYACDRFELPLARDDDVPSWPRVAVDR